MGLVAGRAGGAVVIVRCPLARVVAENAYLHRVARCDRTGRCTPPAGDVAEESTVAKTTSTPVLLPSRSPDRRSGSPDHWRAAEPLPCRLASDRTNTLRWGRRGRQGPRTQDRCTPPRRPPYPWAAAFALREAAYSSTLSRAVIRRSGSVSCFSTSGHPAPARRLPSSMI